MLSVLFGVVVGLILGWFIIPQPTWAKNLWDKMVSKVKD